MDVYELEASREINEGQNPTARMRWHVNGASGYANAKQGLAAELPASFEFDNGELGFLDSVEAQELKSDTFFEFAVEYRSQPLDPAEGDTEFEFDVAAQTEPIFQSISTQSYAPQGQQAPNFYGAVGVEFGNRQPKGRPPLNPFSTFVVTKHWPLAFVDDAYQLAVESLVGAIAANSLFSRQPGTIRFLGANGRQSGKKFPIAYTFGFRPNISNFTANGITINSALGWDLIDWYYVPDADTNAEQPIWKAAAAYVHRVHQYTSLAGLQL